MACSPFLLQLISMVFTWCCETLIAKSYTEKELTVTGSDLKKCGHSNYYCVTDIRDCSSTHALRSGLILDFNCHFMEPTESLICLWKVEEDELAGETESSLILSSTVEIKYCAHILFIGTKINITLKMQNRRKREEWFSGPHYAYLKEIVKTPRPIITEVMTSHKALNVTWTTPNATQGICKIRHKPYSSDQWSTIIEFPLMHHGNKRMYMIDSLQPLTRYTVSVSCQYGLYGDYGTWSDWSKECSGMTSESAPSSPPRVCYNIEDLSATGTHRILLLWKGIPAAKPHGSVLGYRVSYMPSDQPHLIRSVTTSSPKASLVVMRAEYDINVTAFNRAGQSPAQRLRVTAGPRNNVSSVWGLWVYSKDGKLWVQWDADSAISEFAVESVPETNPNDTEWIWKQNSGHVLTLRGEPQQTYNISVYPILGTQCGAPSMLQANLETGALVYMVDLRVATVTRQEAIIKWAWQRKPYQINVIQYSLMLSSESGTKSIPVTPDMSKYTFSSLKASTDYSIHLFAKTQDKSFSIEKQDFTTPQRDLPPDIVTVIVLLLMIIIATSVFSITSRVLYRKYVIVQVADPKQSAVVRWLTASLVTGGDQKVLQVVDLCFNETNEIYVEKTCLMLDDSKRASQDMNSIDGTDDSMHSGGNRYSLTFEDLAVSSPTPSNAGHAHCVPFSEKRDCDVCALAKPGYVDTIPRPSKAADEENFTFKGIDYVEAESIPTFAQGISINSAHTMNISESVSPKNNITDLDSIPQLFKGYVSNIATNMPCTGKIPLHANSDPPPARTGYGETAPRWSSVALSEARSVNSTSTIPASDDMETVSPPMNTGSSENKPPAIINSCLFPDSFAVPANTSYVCIMNHSEGSPCPDKP